jgi:hypothetical protein
VYGLLKICVWFTEKMCVLQSCWGTWNRAQEKKNPFGGGVDRKFRSIGSRYVQWNPLDSSKTIENLLLKKVAILLRIVAFLASSEKTCWSSEKSCHSSEKNNRFVAPGPETSRVCSRPGNCWEEGGGGQRKSTVTMCCTLSWNHHYTVLVLLQRQKFITQFYCCWSESITHFTQS